MKLNKLLALVLALVIVLGLTACGGDTNTTTNNTTESNNTTTVPDTTDAPVVTPVEASVDFEDGSYGFVALYEGKANADASVLSVEDYNGSKALKVANGSGKVPYVAIDVWSLLGEDAAKVASVEMTLGIENPDGTFYACSGKVMLWDSKEPSKTTHDWSVYLENKNPKVATVTLGEGEAFSADAAPLMIVTLDTDNGATAGVANANLYIDNIRFLDASGNLLKADTSVTLAAPNGFSGEKDMSNLVYLSANTVALEGMSGISGTAWGQDGVEMTEEFKAALVPGAVVEIEFSSTSGDMWLVFPDDGKWSRIECQTAAINNSKNICQITYEQIAAVCGEDVSLWGARIQCEASGDWEVYSVKVGQNSGLVTTANKTVLEGFACTGTSWGQNGFELTAEQWALFQPGTIVEIKYTSTSGDMWLVLPDDGKWSRIECQTAACDGNTCQITFEQIAAVCGEDVSLWGARLQCESSGDWEVYSVSVCSGSFASASGMVELEGFACTGDAWGQNGFELTAEQLALLVPGSVIEVKYTSESGAMWIVLPGATTGWTRLDTAGVCDGSTYQVTFEEIASVLGDDVSAWGVKLECESDSAWEVYSVSIGTAG